MLKIAIVDDLASDRNELKKHLHNEMKVWNKEYEISEFSSGEEFLSSLLKIQFKIVFLDIYMTGISGIETAKQLTANSKIIFLTTSTEYIAQSFALHATCYLLKPVNREGIHQAMSLCFPRIGDGSVLSVPVDKSKIVIDRDEIIYIDFMERCTRIHTIDGISKCYLTFAELTAPLKSDMRFVSCRRGVLINMNYISKEINGDFVLTNGEKLPISRSIKKTVLQAFHRYKLDTM